MVNYTTYIATKYKINIINKKLSYVADLPRGFASY